MRALSVTVRDPFHPYLHREVVVVRKRTRLRALAPKTNQPHICLLNGRPILRAGWRQRLRTGDTVAWVVLPQGGGGGSNPLKIVLLIVVAYFAPYLAGQMLGTTYGAYAASALGGSGVFMSVATTAITIAGSMLINALIPPPKPPGSQTAESLAAASPTYSLGAQGNSARIGQPIPVIYGRHKVFPDFAAQPYTEFAGNDQYLYQLMAIGVGEYTIESINIEDTSIDNFEEIEYQLVGPNEAPTLFPINVVTSIEVSGQDAEYGVELGPFTAAPAGTITDTLAFDIALPRGLYYGNDNGGLDSRSLSFQVSYRLIDDDGVAIGSWQAMPVVTISAATTTPIRKSYRYSVYPGRYEAKLVRTTAKVNDTRTGNDLAWIALRAYLRGSLTYGNVTLLAMRMKATSNLSSQASRKINVIAQRLLPVWDPNTGWSSPRATSNPAWAIADIARSDYGAGLDDSRVNLNALYALAQKWEARGDEFNGVFDTIGTVWEALQTVCRAGRAFPFLQGGILHTFRDEPVELPVAMFSPRNMLKGTFKISYKMPSEDMADCVDVEYYDSTVWSWKKVRATLPGSTSTDPAKVKLVGVVRRQQAWQEGMYMAACNRYRRRFLSFDTEMDGFIPSLGDLITVSHDMPKWGQTTEAAAFDPSTGILTTYGDLTFTNGTHYLAFRNRDGSPVGPFVALPTNDPKMVVLSDWDSSVDVEPDTGMGRERAHVVFGPANTQWITARLLSVKPKGIDTCTLEAVVESDFVHTADQGTAPGSTAWQLPATATAPSIVGLTARSMPNDVSRMVLSWQPAPGANIYLIEESADGEAWTRVGETTSNSYSYLALYGAQTLVRVAAVGMMRGPWIQVVYGSIAGYMWTSDSNLMWNADSSTPMWSN